MGFFWWLAVAFCKPVAYMVITNASNITARVVLMNADACLAKKDECRLASLILSHPESLNSGNLFVPEHFILVRMDDETQLPLWRLATAASKGGKSKLAAVLWRRLAANPVALVNWAIESDDVAVYEKALGVATNEQKLVLFGNLAALAIQRGEPGKGRDLCEEGLSLGQHPGLAYNLNTCLRQLGRTQEAIDWTWHQLPFERPRISPSRASGDVTMACVKAGSKYNATYVNRLYHSARCARFVCFTDDRTGLDPGIHIEPITLKTWWAKAEVFKLRGNVLYIDLDTILTENFDVTTIPTATFALLSTAHFENERRSHGFNSSIMAFSASPDLTVVYDLLLHNFNAITNVIYKFDHWLEMLFWQPSSDDSSHFGTTDLVSALPPRTILDFADYHHHNDSSTAMIICFPLHPKPHDLLLRSPVPPIAQYWANLAPSRGDGDDEGR